jgi:transposase
MTDCREILRLAEMGLSRTSIGAALGCSRSTVAEALRRAQIKGLEFPLPEGMGDREPADLLYPEKAKDQNHRMPDCEKLHKELGKKGVTLTLLREEYCNECRQAGEPLPKEPCELAVWKKLRCGFNYHIEAEKNFYSVPYENIKQEMDVRITLSAVEVFYSSLRVCSHPRLYGKAGQYRTIPEHMPEKHKAYTEWNAERFLSWAGSIGENTKTAIAAILSSRKIEQQGCRACIGVLKPADRHDCRPAVGRTQELPCSAAHKSCGVQISRCLCG